MPYPELAGLVQNNMPLNDNRKEKNPLLQEIENDNSPIAEDSPDYVKPEEEDMEEVEISNPPEETPQEEETPDETPEDIKKSPEKPIPPPVIPLPNAEERLAEQRREAEILSHQNKKIVDTIDQAAQIAEPTLDELKQALEKEASGSNWDDLTPLEKSLFKKNFINDRKFAMVHKVTTDIHNIDQWAKKVDLFIDTEQTEQKNKQLLGHEAEFRKFAMIESHRNADMDLLINAFINKLPPAANRKGSLFPVGGGDAPAKPKSDIITDAEEAKKMKLQSPKEYAQKVKAGKIKIEV